MKTTSVSIALTPQSTAFVQQAIAAGKTADDVINMAIEVLQNLQAQQLSWLQSEIIEKGERSGIVATDIDLETEVGNNDFWAHIDSLATEKLKAGSINHNSIALPLA